LGRERERIMRNENGKPFEKRRGLAIVFFGGQGRGTHVHLGDVVGELEERHRLREGVCGGDGGGVGALLGRQFPASRSERRVRDLKKNSVARKAPPPPTTFWIGSEEEVYARVHSPLACSLERLTGAGAAKALADLVGDGGRGAGCVVWVCGESEGGGRARVKREREPVLSTWRWRSAGKSAGFSRSRQNVAFARPFISLGASPRGDGTNSPPSSL
jgi:hypothetical protein